jgi:hypothetical protein
MGQYLDSRLVQLAEITRSQGREAAGRFAASNAVRLDPDGRIRLLLHTSSSSAQAGESLGRRVAELGGEVRGRAGDLIEANMAIEKVEALTGVRDIAWIEPAPLPVALDVVSQGVAATRDSRAMNACSAASCRPPSPPARFMPEASAPVTCTERLAPRSCMTWLRMRSCSWPISIPR